MMRRVQRTAGAAVPGGARGRMFVAMMQDAAYRLRLMYGPGVGGFLLLIHQIDQSPSSPLHGSLGPLASFPIRSLHRPAPA